MRPPSPSRFSFVIPVYNHFSSALTVIGEAQKTGLPVIVVDDGSTDGMAHADLSRENDFAGITFLRHAQNRGKGAALMTGFVAAAKTAHWAITVDADGQHNPADYLSLIRAISSGDRPIVVGCRQGMDHKEIPWTSRFGRKFSNFWVRLAGGPVISDTQSGFRLYPLPDIFDFKTHARRFQFEVEVLVKARWHGMPVVEAPVSVLYQPGNTRVSHFRPFVDFMRNTMVFSRLIIQRILFQPVLRRRRKAP